MSKKELGIYVHIPFCKDKCYYCDFVSFKNIEYKAKCYIECLIKEIKNAPWNEINKNYKVTTIYIGGGTPSYIDSNYIAKILETIQSNIKYSEDLVISGLGFVKIVAACKLEVLINKDVHIYMFDIGLT